jgi:predicted nucleic-acid-binding protein
MRAVDTNVLVRLVVRDSPEQVRLAESFIASGAWASHLVLAEAMWVQDAVYDRTPEQIAGAIDMLLNHKELTIQDAEVVTAALEHFRKRPASRPPAFPTRTPGASVTDQSRFITMDAKVRASSVLPGWRRDQISLIARKGIDPWANRDSISCAAPSS